MKAIATDAWLLKLGNADAVLIRHDDEFVLFDAGFPGREQVVLHALRSLGRKRSDPKHPGQHRLVGLVFEAAAVGHGSAITAQTAARPRRKLRA